jgi:hypothetical protein
MKPNAEQIADAIDRLQSVPMFPSVSGAQREVMRVLYRMVGTPAQLDWLVTTAVDHLDQWRGAVELRGIFCTKFAPADGVEAISKFTTGFTPADCETENLTQRVPEFRQLQGGSAELLSNILSPVKEQRLKEAREFLGLLEDRKRTAPERVGLDAPRAIKELERMSNLARTEIEILEWSLGTANE